MTEQHEGKPESEAMRSVAAKLEEFQIEIEDMKNQSGKEYGVAYVMVARSIGEASVTANALAEIMELDGK